VAIHQGVIATIIITSATHDRAANGLRPPFTISGHCLELPSLNERMPVERGLQPFPQASSTRRSMAG
jgi:hypothetical protein